MRIPGTKVWRAFAELDQFDDARCANFIAAAKRGPGYWFGWVLMVLLGIVAFAATCAAGLLTFWATLTDQFGILDWRAAFTVVTATVYGVISPLLLRDWLLIRRVRRLLKQRGRCGQCGYSILGLLVDEHNSLTCPECGNRLEVPQALAELSAGPDGRRRVVSAGIDMSPGFWTPRRRSMGLRFLKWGGVVAVLAAATLVGPRFYDRMQTAAGVREAKVWMETLTTKMSVETLPTELNAIKGQPGSPASDAGSTIAEVAAEIIGQMLSAYNAATDQFDPAQQGEIPGGLLAAMVRTDFPGAYRYLVPSRASTGGTTSAEHAVLMFSTLPPDLFHESVTKLLAARRPSIVDELNPAPRLTQFFPGSRVHTAWMRSRLTPLIYSQASRPLTIAEMDGLKADVQLLDALYLRPASTYSISGVGEARLDVFTSAAWAQRTAQSDEMRRAIREMANFPSLLTRMPEVAQVSVLEIKLTMGQIWQTVESAQAARAEIAEFVHDWSKLPTAERELFRSLPLLSQFAAELKGVEEIERELLPADLDWRAKLLSMHKTPAPKTHVAWQLAKRVEYAIHFASEQEGLNTARQYLLAADAHRIRHGAFPATLQAIDADLMPKQPALDAFGRELFLVVSAVQVVTDASQPAASVGNRVSVCIRDADEGKYPGINKLAAQFGRTGFPAVGATIELVALGPAEFVGPVTQMRAPPQREQIEGR